MSDASPAPRSQNDSSSALIARWQARSAARVPFLALAACAISTPFVVGIFLALDRRLGAHLLVLIGALAAFEGLAYLLIRTGRYPRWYDFLNAAVEISIPTVIAVIDTARIGPAYALTSAPVMLYGLVVIVTALRLRPRLVLFSGTLGAAEIIVLYFATRADIPADQVASLPSLAASNVLQRGAYVFLAGVVGWGLSKSLLGLLQEVGAQSAAREQADRALQEREEQYRALTEHSPDVIARLDADRRVLFVNQAVRGFGADPATLVGRRLGEVGAPEVFCAPLDRAVGEVFSRGARVDVELELPGAAGTRWMDAQFVPERDREGRVLSVLATLREVTARKLSEKQSQALEEQLRHAQKMEAVGRLAGGVAHDFNNLLTGIISCANSLRDPLPEDHPSRVELGEILEASSRAAGLTRQLLAFSRKQVISPRLVDLGALLASSRKMLSRIIGEDVALDVVLHPGLGSVRADPGQLEQVVVNLAVNARDAMPSGGRLTLRTGEASVAPGAPETSEGVRPGRYVTLAIEDTGCGISPEVRKHLFEPFFTTKDLGRGTGLGLSTVYGIVSQAEGAITVRSEVGKGSVFTLYLPRFDAVAPAASGSTPRKSKGGAETVLVVEDEDLVRSSVRRLLKREGYEVLVAQDGEEGLRLCQSHPGTIDLLLTDVVMPGMSGKALWDAVSGTRPDLRVLFMSGYTDDILAPHRVLDARTPFIEKPFEPDRLLSKLREVLDAPRGRAA